MQVKPRPTRHETDQPVDAPRIEPTMAIATWVAAASYDDLPAKVVGEAKTAILDTIGVALMGSKHRVVDIAAAYAQAQSGAGPATVVGRRFRTSSELAALVNGVAAHALDYDDGGHSSTHTVPVALALGESRGGTGRDFLLAYVIGREVRMHMDEEIDRGRFEGRGPGSRGWHATGTLGTFGAVATASKILGLDPPTICSAFGISASLAGGLMANFGTMTKPLHAGNAARNGVLAASLAEKGFTGEPTIFSAHWGFVEAQCLPGEGNMWNVAAGLRDYWHLAERGARIKPYPSCSGTHPYIDAARALRERHRLTPDQIATIETTRSGSLIRLYPKTPLECKFSAGFAIAAVLVDGTLIEEHCTEAFLARADVQGLLARTTYVGEPDKDQRIRITTVSGEVYERRVPPIEGLSDDKDKVAKFYACAEPVVGARNARRIEEMVTSLERLGTIAELGELLAGSPS